MALGWSEHPSARAEFFDAILWYEDQETGLGNRFADSLAESIRHICEWPEAVPRHRGITQHPFIRTIGLEGFPYQIIYLVQGDEVIVLAYAHQRRRPGYRRNRPAGVNNRTEQT